MEQYNSQSEKGIPDHFNFKRIEVSDDFASRVMDRIAVKKAGGLSALSSASKILLLSVIVMVYSSLGAFIGIQSHKNLVFHEMNKKEKAIIELRRTHYLDPISNFDNILRPFETTNN